MKRLLLAIIAIASSTACLAQTMSGVCMIWKSQRINKANTMQLMLSENNCENSNDNCMEMSNNSVDWQRWTGVSQQMLQQDGATITALLTGDAGEVSCNGIVHDGVLAGRFRFIANSAFPTADGNPGL